MIDDDGKLQRRYINKRVNANKEGIDFLLSYSEFRSLIKRAKLVSSQLGFTGENYVLARYKDKGPYSVENCRFITHCENMREQKRTDKQREASRRNSKLGIKAARKKLTSRLLSLGGKHGAASRAISLAAEIEARDTEVCSRLVFKTWVRYPERGWKHRLAKELELTDRQCFLFLKRNPSYVHRCIGRVV